VLVIDDGSPDGTADRAREAGAQVLRHEINRGKGAAIKSGLRELVARPIEYLILLDGDGQHLPEEIPLFLKKANKSRPAMIVGNRMSKTDEMPMVRRLTNRLMSWSISRLCRQAIPDSQCGFRMIRRDLAPELFCETDAYDYETEMLFVASKRGYTVDSVPVSTVYGDEKSKIRPVRDTIRFLRLLRRYKKA
jgi:glycosyltransferase involved in cell wall biosynthesis